MKSKLARSFASIGSFHHYLNVGGVDTTPLAIGSDSVALKSPREVITELASSAQSVLEIGPFCSPALTGPNVRYLDVLDKDGLTARASEHKMDPVGIPDIHYVSPLGDLSIVREKFDAIFSSHNIEHQPDLIGHLLKATELLNMGGTYFLLIPDKRYCFDHFISESTLSSVLEAFHERRTKHTLASLIAHRALTTHNDPVRHWDGDHGGEDFYSEQIWRFNASMIEFESAVGDYIDCHAWQFTPDTFKRIIDALTAMGFLRYHCEIFETVRGSCEFGAILTYT